MPRTVDATLTAALAKGEGLPYLKGYIGHSNGLVDHADMVCAYKLTGSTLEFEMPYIADMGGDQDSIWLERGLTINGTTYTVTTSRFWIESQTYLPNNHQIAKGTLIPRKKYTADGFHDYSVVLDAFATAQGKTAVFREPADAWLAYHFFPNYQVITLNDANRMANLLQQKYLIFLCDNGNEEMLFYSLAHRTLNDDPDFTYSATNDYVRARTRIRNRQLIWRDENETVHTVGSAIYPLHNLGFLQSTAIPPIQRAALDSMEYHMRPDLRLVDGDLVLIDLPTTGHMLWALITEQYTAPSRNRPQPRWETIITANELYGNTAGGAMPSTIERVSNYTPLNTSSFDRILGADDNNLQAAIDHLDDHAHFLPFSNYVDFAPMLPGTKYPFTATIDRPLTLRRWTQHYIISGANDGTNYWRIRIGRYSDLAVVAEMDTRTVSLLTTESFDIATVTPANLGLYVECTAINAPGALYLIGPALEVTG